MTVYEYNEEILIVDAGMMFPDNDMIGIDYIIPDFEYVKQHADKVRGIVITHGHEDHTGAISHLWKLFKPGIRHPVDHRLDQSQARQRGFVQDANLKTIQAGDVLQIGPFKVHTFHVCHSIPDG